MQTLRMVQLPVPPPAAFAATGNVPMAAGCLAVAARVHGLSSRVQIEVAPPECTDSLGDTRLADWIARDEPELVAFSLYLWNVERSLHIAREVKKRSPRTAIIVGGPEVSTDNPFLLSQDGFDFAVAGEGEAIFANLLDRLLNGENVHGLPGVAVRGGRGMGPFGDPAPAKFALQDYSSPYVEGLIPVDPRRATYVESVRGCRSHCTFCFYPRSSNVLRTLDVDATANLIAQLKERGAREFVFLDATFNHRPEFVALVDAIANVNTDRSVTFFAEVRAEGLTPDHAARLARAGFHRIEIGLQSVNTQTLKRIRRGGSPERVAQAARLLKDQGIELLVDLIVGLPGDSRSDIAHGVDFLLDHDLGDSAQVFPLSLLPGTAMRTDAERDGITFDPAPPYRVRRTAWMNEGDWKAALFEAEARLGRRLDEFPRPHLVSHSEVSDPPDVFFIDLDHDGDAVSRLRQPGARHVAVWLRSQDLFDLRHVIRRALEARLDIDPYATLDVVLNPTGPFPLNLIDELKALLAEATPSYLSRVLAHRGENLQRRLVAVLPPDTEFAPDYITALRQEIPVYVDQRLLEALRDPEGLGARLPRARILDAEVNSRDWKCLREKTDPEAVSFAFRSLERDWQWNVLSYNDAADR
jgi:radical SAM superfamily enzyme YgiQ (UPF0313 family)